MTDHNIQDQAYPPPRPNPDLRSLDRLVGTWHISGGAEGIKRYVRNGK